MSKFKNVLLILLLVFKNSNGKIQLNHKADAYGTHQPVLAAIVNKTTGPIIEFGSGYNSTDLLHQMCKKNKRMLVTVDDDLDWLNKFKNKYLNDGYEEDNTGWHKFYFVPGKYDNVNADHWIKFLENFDLLKNVQFDMCFVDQSPWHARTCTILKLKNQIKYILLHDCDYLAHPPLGKTIKTFDTVNYKPGIYDFTNTFKFFKVYFPNSPWPGHSGPPTLLGSNFDSDLPDIDFDINEIE